MVEDINRALEGKGIEDSEVLGIDNKDPELNEEGLVNQSVNKLHVKNNLEKKGTLFCSECGVKRDNNAKFCQNCGASFEKFGGLDKSNKIISKCPYCAEEINPGAVKCKHCGEWLNKKAESEVKKEDHSAAIALGYIFSILGGVIGLVFALYLVTRQDKRARDHGGIMLIIFLVWILILILLISSFISSTYDPYYY